MVTADVDRYMRTIVFTQSYLKKLQHSVLLVKKAFDP